MMPVVGGTFIPGGFTVTGIITTFTSKKKSDNSLILPENLRPIAFGYGVLCRIEVAHSKYAFMLCKGNFGRGAVFRRKARKAVR